MDDSTQQGVLFVTKTIPFAAGFALTVLLFASTAMAQAPAPAGYSAPQVATLDLAYLFRNHLRYKQLDDALKGEVQQAETTFTNEQKSMQELARRLQEYKSGSPEYKAIEEELAKKEADLRLRGAIMQKNFAEKKAKIYFDVLQDVKNYVRYHAEQHGVMLVVNFNGDEIDGTNPQSVMRGLNETVLYQHRAVDITPVILEMCNKGVVVPNATPNPSAQLPGGVLPRQ
jgi:Skp family chaperone for outer membrane proteins